MKLLTNEIMHRTKYACWRFRAVFGLPNDNLRNRNEIMLRAIDEVTEELRMQCR